MNNETPRAPAAPIVGKPQPLVAAETANPPVPIVEAPPTLASLAQDPNLPEPAPVLPSSGTTESEQTAKLFSPSQPAKEPAPVLSSSNEAAPDADRKPPTQQAAESAPPAAEEPTREPDPQEPQRAEPVPRPQEGPNPETSPTPEAPLPSGKLMWHIAEGKFDDNAYDTRNTTDAKTEVAPTSFNALETQHDITREKDSAARQRMLREKLKSEGKTDEEIQAVLYHEEMSYWAKRQAKRIEGYVEAAQDKQAMIAALTKLGFAVTNDTYDASTLQQALYQATGNTGESGEFYKKFCIKAVNTNKELAATLTTTEMDTLQPFLMDVLGGETAFNALKALRQTQDMLRENESISKQFDVFRKEQVLRDSETEVFGYFKEGAQMAVRKTRQQAQPTSSGSEATAPSQREDPLIPDSFYKTASSLEQLSIPPTQDLARGYQEFRQAVVPLIAAKDLPSLNKLRQRLGLPSIDEDYFSTITAHAPASRMYLQDMYTQALARHYSPLGEPLSGIPTVGLFEAYQQLSIPNPSRQNDMQARANERSRLLPLVLTDALGIPQKAQIDNDAEVSNAVSHFDRVLTSYSQVGGSQRQQLENSFANLLNKVSSRIPHNFHVKDLDEFLSFIKKAKIVPPQGATSYRYRYIPQFELTVNQKTKAQYMKEQIQYEEKMQDLKRKYGSSLDQNTVSTNNMKRMYEQIASRNPYADRTDILQGVDQLFDSVMGPEQQASFQIGGVSLQGLSHEHNEDALLMDPERGIIGVFDGMGGMGGENAGAFASRIARAEMKNALNSISGDITPEKIKDAMERGWQAAKESLREHEAEFGEDKDFATTGTLIYVYTYNGQKRAAIIHEGDSRAYAIKKDGTMQPLTKDDSLLEAAVARGEISRSDAEILDDVIDQKVIPAHLSTYWQQRNRVLRSFAGTGSPQPPYNDIAIDDSVAFIAATSDGIHDNLTRQQMRAAVQGQTSPRAVAKRLVTAAHYTFVHNVHVGTAPYIRNIDMHTPNVNRQKDDDLTAVVLKVN